MKSSKKVELNSPKERMIRLRHRSPGKVSTGSHYFDSLKDRIDFRNKMRYELKATAKESFDEELGQLRRSNQLAVFTDNEKQFQLEREVHELRKIVDDLKGQNESPQQRNENTNAIEAHWAAMQQYPPHGSFDRFASDNSSVSSLVARNNPNFMPALTSSPNKKRQHQNNGTGVSKNGLFVLSCAPLQNFEDVVHSELSIIGNGDDKKGRNAPVTLTHQIQQYNELQSLFALPSYESEFQNIYAMQRDHQLASRQQQQQQMASNMYEERDAKEERLQSAIDKHRSRLEVSREIYTAKHSPRAPSSPPARTKSISSRSPRPNTNGTSTYLRRSPSPNKSNTAPSPYSHRLFTANSTGMADMGASMEGTSLLLDANSSLKEIVRSSMNEYVTQTDAREGSPSNAQPSALRVQDLSVDEFRNITDKMKDDIQRLIEDTVREELLADSKARKYTKRAEASTLSTHEVPLNQKIEAKVGDKIQALKNELASLRMTKLHLKPVDKKTGESTRSPDKFMSRRPNRGGATVDNEDDDSLGYGEDGDRPLGDSNWFSKNELGMRSNPESPVQRTGNGLGRIGEKGLEENDDQRDGAAAVPSGLDHMSRELLLSIEGILRRHIGTAPEGGQPNDISGAVPFAHPENSMVSQLTDFDQEYYQQQHTPLRQHTYSNSSAEEFRVKLPVSQQQQLQQQQQQHHLQAPVGMKNPQSPNIRKFSLGLGEIFQQNQPKPSTPTNRGGREQLKPQNHHQQLQQQQYQQPTHHPQQTYQGQSQNQHADNRVILQSQTARGAGPIFVANDSSHVTPQAPPVLFVPQHLEQDNTVQVPVSLQAVPSSSSISVMSKASKPQQRVADSRQLRQDASTTVQNEAELKSAEAEYRNLMTLLLEKNDVKSTIKKVLKTWNTTFEVENGRPAGDADKAVINDKFVAYKMVSSQVVDFKAQIKNAEEKIKRLKER